VPRRQRRISIHDILALPEPQRSRAVAHLRRASRDEAAALAPWWPFWARPEQLAPAGTWRTWLFLGGRGAGKTRAGAEWVRGEVEAGRRSRIALVGSTIADVREVMIEGPSGLRAIAPLSRRPTYEASRRRLSWPSGALAYVFSAEDPDALRGPQFDGAWLDEFASWSAPSAAYDMLQFGLRIGRQPCQVVTTTPRSIAALRRMIAAPDTVVTHAATAANAAHLSSAFIRAVTATYAGTRLGRQELEGVLIDDPEGALWSRALVESAFDPHPPEFDRVVVAVDPPVSVGPNADACGIVVAGAVGEGAARKAWVLADRTCQGLSPERWARRVVETAQAFDADRVVAEVNQGGALVRTLLEIVDPNLPVREVFATRGKRARAEPIAALYERRRVAHAGRFAQLEDQMCAFGAPEVSGGSPDRVDALVWALTALLLDGVSAPRLRAL